MSEMETEILRKYGKEGEQALLRNSTPAYADVVIVNQLKTLNGTAKLARLD